MKKKTLKIFLKTRVLAMAAVGMLMPALTSCMNEDLEPSDEITAPSESILIGANLTKEISTRGKYIDSGPITEGQMYVMYTSKSNSKFALATADFDERGDGKAVAGNMQDGQFNWGVIGKTTFYMDNVPQSMNSTSTVEKVTFNNSSTFTAGPILPDAADPEQLMADNDLLWGTTTATTNSKNINFDLHHVMSKFKVVVTVDNTNAIGDQFDFDNAEVYITNLVHKAYQYNRETGEVSIKEKPDYENMTVVQMMEDAVEKIDWASKEVDEEDPNLVTYTSHDIILPPQGLLSDDQRPKLVIKMKSELYPEGKTYSGFLPHAMEVDYDGLTSSYPANLAFLREHYLTIRTKLSKEPPGLIFMPVWVYKWVDKGEYTMDGYQAGVYSDSDFDRLMLYYEQGNNTMLRTFGKRSTDGSWNFNIFGNLHLKLSDIAGRMPVTGGRPNYSFYLEGYFTVYIEDDDDNVIYELKKDAGARALYDILTKGTTDYPLVN